MRRPTLAGSRFRTAAPGSPTRTCQASAASGKLRKCLRNPQNCRDGGTGRRSGLQILSKLRGLLKTFVTEKIHTFLLTRSSRYFRRHHHPLLRCHLRLSFPLRLPPPLVRLESGHRQWPPDHKGVRRDILNVLCSCSIVRPTPVLPKRIKMSRGHGGAANVERH